MLTTMNRIFHWGLLGLISIFMLLGFVDVVSHVVSFIAGLVLLAGMLGWCIWHQLNE